MSDIANKKDKFLKKEEDNEMSGKDKNIYVRWDMLCQIINHWLEESRILLWVLHQLAQILKGRTIGESCTLDP